MADSVILNKVASIERCVQRVKEDYIGHEEDFETNFMRQDAVILNLQRACELSIDLSNHLVKIKQLGIPQNSRHAFELLSDSDFISKELANDLADMVGFRNVAVYNYTKLDLAVVRSIIENHLNTFLNFTEGALKFA